jgi:hypothetical protein
MKHHIHDQKTPFLFKLEASGTSMTALSSKTYCLVKNDGETKYAAKGVKRTAIEKSRDGDDGDDHVFKKMKTALETKTCGEPVSNTTFRTDHKGMRMTTMTVTKAPYNSIYTKRKVCPNGIDTHPLSLTLEPPTKRHNPVGFNPGGHLNRFPKPKLTKRKYTRKTNTTKAAVSNKYRKTTNTPAVAAAAAAVITPADHPPLTTVQQNIQAVNSTSNGNFKVTVVEIEPPPRSNPDVEIEDLWEDMSTDVQPPCNPDMEIEDLWEDDVNIQDIQDM